MNKPEVVSSMCAAPMCFDPPVNGLLCRKHLLYKRIATVLMGLSIAIAIFIGFMTILSVTGCAAAPATEESGISKARLKELLHECRASNRERVRIIKEYDSIPMFDFRSKCHKMDGVDGWVCPSVSDASRPSQDFGTIGFGEAGN